jgi:hypothetical protein
MYLLQNVPQRITDSTGNICAGALMYTYITGTTTNKTAYTDQAGATPHANPIVADAGGVFPQVWLNSDAEYRIKVTKSDGTVLFTWDDVSGIGGAAVLADLAASSGSSLIGHIAASGSARTVQSKLREYVSVTDYLAAGFDTTLDANVATTTAAFTTALATGKAVYVPAGTYVVQLVSLPSNSVIFGDGPNTIIKQLTTAVGYPYVFKIDGATATVANNVRNVTVRDLMVYRATRNAITSAGDADQFTHLIGISAASEVLFERVWFKGFNGDGLYIGSGFAGGEERHNENIVVRDCVFDGVDHENRNAISVIDCRGLLVTGCAFMNCSSQYMPGAIDVEPNSDAFHVIRDIKIVDNFFYNNGGSNGSVSILLSSGFTTPPSGFLVEGNTIDGGTYAQDRGILVREMGDATAAKNHNVKIVNNTMRGTTLAALIWGINGALVRDNTFTDVAAGMQVGGNVASTKCMNVQVVGNEFTRIAATAGGAGLYVFNADYVDILDNRFIDVGKTDNTFGYAIDFHNGTSTFVRVDGNRIENPNGRTTVAIQKEAGHTFTPAGNRYGENELAGLGNFFSPRPGTATYDPASLADGAGATTTVTVTGAALGDYVDVSFSQALAGVLLTGWVSATDTVSVRFQNESGGVVDLASGTISARVRRA